MQGRHRETWALVVLVVVVVVVWVLGCQNVALGCPSGWCTTPQGLHSPAPSSSAWERRKEGNL